MCEKGHKGDSRWILGGIAGLFAVLVSVSGVFADVVIGIPIDTTSIIPPYFHGRCDNGGFSDKKRRYFDSLTKP